MSRSIPDEFKEKWNEHEAMMTYMNEQWFTGVFNQWQIYLNDPGYANTNSNNESNNNDMLKKLILLNKIGFE